MTIDVHAHALSEKFLADLTKRPIAGIKSHVDDKGRYSYQRASDESASTLDPNLHDLPRRIASLKARGVTLQLFGPPPSFLSWLDGAASIELVRALHRQALDLAGQSDGLMEPMAVLALGEPEKAAGELQRTIDEYGLRAVMLPSSAGGLPLDAKCFADVFALIEKLKLLVFMHPTSGFPTARFGINGMNVLLGWPFETTLSVTRLIFSGVLHRHPELKLVMAHGGGNLVFLRGRLDAAYEAKGWEANPYYQNEITRPPTDYLDRLYYDTCTLSPDSTRFLISVMGADCVLFGSDFPFDIGDPEGARAMPAIRELSPESQKKILRDNAMCLLTNR